LPEERQGTVLCLLLKANPMHVHLKVSEANTHGGDRKLSPVSFHVDMKLEIKYNTADNMKITRIK